MIVKEGGLCAKNEDPKVEAIPLFNYQNGTTIYDTLLAPSLQSYANMLTSLFENE